MAEAALDPRPLAERMRPARLDDFVGQEHLLAPGRPLRRAVESGQLHSMVFWGPPGTGKTTLARIVAAAGEAEFLTLSAVLSGVREIRAAVEAAQRARAAGGRRSVVFVDEVHRFNRAQQDAFLPHVEDGTFTFIGATTENPSFELNAALLSRVRVYVLRPLGEAHLLGLLGRAVEARGAPTPAAEALALIAQVADGDARRALTLLDVALGLAADAPLDVALAREVVAGGASRRFDKGGDVFHDQISALHKSVRGSDPDAALYWYARMLDGGCDPHYLARRVVRIASEDVGNADPRGLALALDAWDAYTRLGSPEGELAIAQALVYLACCAKSDAVYTAFEAVRAEVRASGTQEVPLHLRNAPTALLAGLGHGRSYRHAHDTPEGYVADEQYLPDALHGRRWYAPVPRGLELRIGEKLAQLRALDRAARGEPAA